ncbi:unnamed protein product [Acanthoscelides obtectus]|uniref:Uncharacterized protein n=1 Tax=Acanthoscelides obtectus TaxID=200917 RepID=A0A9P0L735_ACAOB|nr:unnamed protein product [Acanthoscelides obtectus]CAK1626451.1 hypothetical protein AOBTE_LOCUS3852 [Acanthoscelides obtectus]
MMVVLYEVIKMTDWSRVPPESIDNITRKLLEMLQHSIDPQLTDIYNYVPLRKGIRICLCNMMEILSKKRLVKMLHLMLKVISQPDQNSSVQKSLSNLAIIAATEYRKKTSRPFSAKGPMPLIFGVYFCKDPNLNVIATMIWKSLLDARNIVRVFYSPRVYFEDTLYDLPYCKVRREDKVFFKSVQRFIFESIVYGIVNCTEREILYYYHETIGLTLVTVRCSAAASCFVAVGMAVQEYAFTITKKQLVRSHHLHAFVLSVMTLVCYVFRAKVLYKYVISIMKNRAEWAPHLNPPIHQKYKYAAHHILWNKPDLFFDDWEVKYGLWKCFRVKKDIIPKGSVKRHKKK